MTDNQTPHYEGHRARLKARFVEGDGKTLPDYELLELLLFSGIPRRDTKPLAKALIARFGGLDGVFTAGYDDLKSFSGMTESAAILIMATAQVATRIIKADVMDKPILTSWQRLLDYLHATMANAKIEQFRVLYLNRKNVLIHDEIHREGTVDQSAVYPREIIKKALDLGATAIILIHNHPSGDPSPSEADLYLTNEVIDACRPLGIAVHDHIIVAKSGHLSFKSAGLI